MKNDEIAIIGMAGRFPGADSVEEYWQNLVDGVDSSRSVTPGVADFDAEFFGFEADQATYTDPQHRMFLEVAWAAFEDSGYVPTELDLSIGVFASTSLNLYLLMQMRAGVVPHPPHQTADHMPALVAYQLGARGPTMAVQSACSGSLVAVCMAAQSLLDFRCDMAIAGGSRVHLPEFPDASAGLAAPDGVVRAFDRDAQGTAFGSGAGAVVMRRMADALADGDHIHAVLRGWAVTNDGADRGGYAVPGVNGQATAVVEALAVADLSPEDVGFVEAHGSGTLLGDAIEVTALRRVFNDEVCRTVYLGSGKTNIGHLDAASGIAGLIKAVLTVEHGTIPGNLHFSTPNPQADFGPFVVPTETFPWPIEDEPGCGRIAGVSSFGMGGTNAHVLVSGTDEIDPRKARNDDVAHVLWLSARTPEALQAMAGRLGEHLARVEHPLEDVAFTLATGRARFLFGAAVVCLDLDDALEGLARVATGGPGDEVPLDLPDPEAPARRVSLPAYPFERQHFWVHGVEEPA
jgi:phthiocerol/phenolphthiocerol synthesis type-I polyketide synthase E